VCNELRDKFKEWTKLGNVEEAPNQSSPNLNLKKKKKILVPPRYASRANLL